MKSGYEVGKGRTFTPSTNAKWIDEFNDLLNQSNLSRNALTEKLIEDGLKYNNRKFIVLDAADLTPEQVEILSSEPGREILKNVLKLLLGEQKTFEGNLLNVKSENKNESFQNVEEKLVQNNPALEKARNKIKKLNDSREFLK